MLAAAAPAHAHAAALAPAPTPTPTHAGQSAAPDWSSAQGLNATLDRLLAAGRTSDAALRSVTQELANTPVVRQIQAEAATMGRQLERFAQGEQERHAPPAITDRAHPGHAVFADMQTKLDAFNAEQGVRMEPRQRDQLAAALAVQVHGDPMLRNIDRIAVSGPGRDQQIFAMQDYPYSGSVGVDVFQGMNAPIAQSTEQWNQISQQQEQQRQELQQQQALQQGRGMHH
jgi:hypothetical protein